MDLTARAARRSSHSSTFRSSPEAPAPPGSHRCPCPLPASPSRPHSTARSPVPPALLPSGLGAFAFFPNARICGAHLPPCTHLPPCNVCVCVCVCVAYMQALTRTLLPSPLGFLCVPYMYALCVCLICMPYMYALSPHPRLSSRAGGLCAHPLCSAHLCPGFFVCSWCFFFLVPVAWLAVVI